MRILHIVKVGGLANGISSVIISLSSAQKKNGEDVRVLNLESKCLDFPGGITCSSKHEFIRELDTFNPDIVIFHGMYYPELKSYSKIIRKRNIPYLIQPHGSFSIEHYNSKKLKNFIFQKLFLTQFIANSRGFIFLNEHERDNFVFRKPSVREFIVPNGCESHDNRAKAENKIHKLTFLYLSRIAILHKGLDYLVEGIKLFLSEYKESYGSEVEFIFYGPGREKDLETFKNLIEPIKSSIFYGGPVHGEEKLKAYENADVFILTSRFEGFPVSVLEALSFGVPCMVSEATNVADIIRKYKCGWVLENTNPSTIARMLVHIVKEYRKERESLIANSISASENYSWNKIADIAVGVYSDVIDNKKG